MGGKLEGLQWRAGHFPLISGQSGQNGRVKTVDIFLSSEYPPWCSLVCLPGKNLISKGFGFVPIPMVILYLLSGALLPVGGRCFSERVFHQIPLYKEAKNE
jgi:hypothetical protein